MSTASASPRETGQASIPSTATDFIFPVGNPRIAPTYDYNNANGFTITQMFNDSCDPSQGQGYYSGGTYFCGHTGVDLSDKQSGDQVHAVANGVVVVAGFNSTYGEMIRIQHVLSDGSIIYSQYEHMEYGSLQVVAGQTVTLGQEIGLVGSTGFVTGPHLHFEMKSVNEDGVGYSFGNAGLLVGYDEPLSYIVQHTAGLVPTPTALATVATSAISGTAQAGITSTVVTSMVVTTTALASPSPAPSPSSTPQAAVQGYITVMAPRLNVRAGSGYEYSPVNSVNQGTRLGYLGMTGNGWVHVALPSNATGFVVRQWVAGSPLPQLPPATGHAAPATVQVHDTRYPARAGPMMRDAAIEPLQPGERLGYLGTHISWDRVVLPTGRIGWVLNWYLSRPAHSITVDAQGAASLVGPSTAASSQSAANGATRPATGSRRRVRVSGMTAGRTMRLSRLSLRVNGVQGVVTGGQVNVRRGPTTAAPVIATVRRGERLFVKRIARGWAWVDVGRGLSGFASSRFIGLRIGSTSRAPHVASRRALVLAPGHGSSSGSSGAPRSEHISSPLARVVVVAANLHTAPRLKAPVVLSLRRGATVHTCGANGPWECVSLSGGGSAWVMRSLVH